jgi:putative membrane protein
MKTMLLATILVALALPSAATAQQTKSTASAPTTSEFVKKAAMTNMFEVQAGQLAQQKSKVAQIHDYAKMIETDHNKAQQELKSKVQDIKGVELPSTLDEEHQKLINQLRSASDGKFEQEFKTQQVKGHQEGVKLFQNYSEHGDNAELKQWAGATTPVLQKHLSAAERLPTTAGTVGSSK